MLLVAILVLTNTVSADGSISGVYNASLQLAEQTGKSNTEVKEIQEDLKELVKPEEKPAPPPAKDNTDQPQDQNKSGAKIGNGHSKR